MRRQLVRIHPAPDELGRCVQEALAALVPVKFVGCPNAGECQEGDVLISLSGKDAVLRELPRNRIKCFHVSENGVPYGSSISDHIQFGSGRGVDERLRGRRLPHESVSKHIAPSIQLGDHVLASFKGEPIWVAREQQGLSLQIVSVPLPVLSFQENLFDYFRKKRFFPYLPLLHFLREATHGSGWKAPHLRACLMLDDPNLHLMSYGFVRFQSLVDSAIAERFHVAFATVPLDAWAFHPRAVKLFKDHPKQFSLLVHGNDHTKHELSQKRAREYYVRLGAQSLRRIERLEKTTGLHVARVMAPPHGDCTDSCLTAMLTIGFEGVCTTPRSLIKCGELTRRPTFGLQLAETSTGRAAVIPRFRLDASCEDAIVLSAFLNRPIIPVGHHHTAADGLGLLTSTAAIINSLGDVSWQGPEDILRSNFRYEQKGTMLSIEPHSSRVHVKVPEGIQKIRFEPPEGIVKGVADFAISVRQGSHTRRRVVSSGAVEVKTGDLVEAVSIDLGRVVHSKVENPEFSISLRALPRRLLCELRDRLMPALPRSLIPTAWTRG